MASECQKDHRSAGWLLRKNRLAVLWRDQAFLRMGLSLRLGSLFEGKQKDTEALVFCGGGARGVPSRTSFW